MRHNIPSHLEPELSWNAQGYEKIAREKMGIEVSERRLAMQLFSRHATVRSKEPARELLSSADLGERTELRCVKIQSQRFAVVSSFSVDGRTVPFIPAQET